MAKLTTEEFIAAIKELTVLELNDLVKACEEEFGVSAAAGVAVVAAGPAEAAEEKTEFNAELTARGCQKAAQFVNFCDAFSIPVLTLTNVNGFKATMCSERNIAAAAAKLTYAFANATVPKVNVIVGKAFGNAYNVMNSKAIGADMVYAWPNAEIGMMDAKLAAKIMYADADVATINEKAAEYADLTEHTVTSLRRVEPSVFSLQDQIQTGEDGSFEDLIADPEAKIPGSFISNQDSGRLLRSAMKRLDPRERKILLLRFCGNKTLDEVSRIIGKTRERVRQIQNQALAKLRKIMEEEGEILTSV